MFAAFELNNSMSMQKNAKKYLQFIKLSFIIPSLTVEDNKSLEPLENRALQAFYGCLEVSNVFISL